MAYSSIRTDLVLSYTAPNCNRRLRMAFCQSVSTVDAENRPHFRDNLECCMRNIFSRHPHTSDFRLRLAEDTLASEMQRHRRKFANIPTDHSTYPNRVHYLRPLVLRNCRRDKDLLHVVACADENEAEIKTFLIT